MQYLSFMRTSEKQQVLVAPYCYKLFVTIKCKLSSGTEPDIQMSNPKSSFCFKCFYKCQYNAENKSHQENNGSNRCKQTLSLMNRLCSEADKDLQSAHIQLNVVLPISVTAFLECFPVPHISVSPQIYFWGLGMRIKNRMVLGVVVVCRTWMKHGL